MKLLKGDNIKVLAGKDKGKEGIVEKTYRKQNKVLVLNINVYKKHIKKNEKMPKGGVVELPRPIDVSKLGLICPKCKKVTRVGYKIEKDKKIRFCKKCLEKLTK